MLCMPYMSCYEASNALDRSRTIHLTMCGATMQMSIKDPTTEWDLRLHAMIKQAALGKKGGLKPMMYEEWLLCYDNGDNTVPEDPITHKCIYT